MVGQMCLCVFGDVKVCVCVCVCVCIYTMSQRGLKNMCVGDEFIVYLSGVSGEATCSLPECKMND